MESPRYEIIAGFSVEPDHRTKIILAEFFPQFDWEDTIEDSAPIRLLEPQAHWQRLLNLANFDGDVAVDWAAPRPENGDAGEDWPTCWNS
jgi:hypothetical protein